MSKLRQFTGKSTSRISVNVDSTTVGKIDRLIGYPFGNGHPADGSRIEFVRQAISEKLTRDSGKTRN
jgi:hypothetical protein